MLAAVVAALTLLALPALASASWNLTVAKTTVPSGGTGFGFTVTGPTSVAAITGVNDGGSVQRTGLTEGTTNTENYTVTENDPGSGWTVTGISCSGSGSSVQSTDLANRKVVLRANGSGTPNVTCTFTNTSTATTGTIKVQKGGDRNLGDTTTSGYAQGLSGVTFEYTSDAAKASNPASTGWTLFPGVTNASGVATVDVPAGTYYVREQTAAAGFGAFGPVTQLTYDPSSGTPTTQQPYAARVTISNGQTTEVFPNQTPNNNAANWDTTSGNNAGSGSPFVNVRDNALFPNNCGLNILLVLDRSGSISPFKTDYADAAKAFVSSLNGTPSQIGIISFSAGSSSPPLTGGVNSYTDGSGTANQTQSPLSLATPANAATLNGVIDNVYASPSGGTNWDLALQKASQAAGFNTDIVTGQTTKPDVVVFITDGNPTARSTAGSDTGSDVNLLDLTAGMSSANSVKNVLSRGSTHVKLFALGVGTGVTADNLKVVSGPAAGEDYDTPTIAALNAKLQELAAKSCGARVYLRKRLQGGNTNQSGWNFTGSASSGTATYLDGNRSTHSTATEIQTGVVVANVPGASTNITIAEDASGQPLTEFDLKSVVCKDQSYDTGNTVSLTSPTSFGGTVNVPRSGSVYCTFTNGPRTPNLAISKTPDAQTISAGDDAEFTITVTNNGTGSATNVKITDTLPAGPTWTVSQQPAGSTCTITSGVLSCPSIGTLAPGASKTVKVKTTTSAAQCATYNNTATVTSDTEANKSDAGQITCQKPNLSIVKTPDAQTINAGDDAEFTMVVSNAGPGTAKGVTVSDTLPAGPTWTVSQQPAGSTCTITSGVLSCPSIGDLASGASKTIKVKTTTSAAQCGTYNNTGSANATNIAAPVTDAGQITCQKPNLSIVKTPDAQTINAGDDAEFTMVVSNAGPGTAKGVTVSDTLPAGPTWTVSQQPAGSTCTITSGVLSCPSIGDLASGASKTIKVKTTTSAAQCGTYNNTGSANATNIAAPVTDAGQITCQKPNLSIVKTPDAQTINAGDDAEFTMVVSNAGPGTAKGVTVSDTLPAGPTWTVSQQPAGSTCTITSGVLSCPSIGDLASGASKTIKVKTTTSAAQCGTYNNTGSANATNIAAPVTDTGQITCQRAGVSLTKTPGATPINAGETASFTITASNAGPGVANDVTVTDTLPSSYTWSINPANAACSITAGVLTCNFGTINAGSSKSVTITAPTSYSACGVIPNTAQATSSNAGTINDAQSSITCQKPALTLDKKADAASVNAGDPIGFTMTAKNNGPGVAKSVTLSDTLPTGVTWAINPANAACSITAGVLSCNFGNLSAGDTKSVHISATTTESACGTYDNTATLSSSNHPNVESSDSILCNKPGLDVKKAALNVTVNAGDDLQFDITTSNIGPGIARSVTLVDPLPAGVTWTIATQPAGDPCSITAGTLNCSFGDLNAGESRVVTIKAATSYEACGSYPNTATADATNAPAKESSASIECQKPALTFTKKADKATVDAGDAIGFTMTAHNNGPGLAKSVTLTDTLPLGPTWSISPAVSGCSITAGVLTCNFGDLASGDTKTVHISATTSYAECSTYTNTGQLTASNHPNLTDSDSVACQKPDLTVTKTADAGSVNAGEQIGFTITTKNTGDGTAKNVTLTDTLPAGPTWTISPANPDCSITSGVLSCTFGNLAKNDSASVHVVATTSYAECSVYLNSAMAQADNAPAVSDGDKVTCNKPNVAFTKKADKATVNAGEQIGFTITAKNNGDGKAKNVTLSDTLPAGPTWTISPANPDCSITAGVLSCTFGDLAKNDSASVHIVADTSTTECGTYDNTAKLTIGNAPGDEASDSVTCQKPSLTITKKADAATVNAGEAIGFTVKVVNNGDGTAKNVKVSDPLPAGPTWTISPANADCSITTGTLNCSFGDLAKNDSAEVHITADTSYAECSKYDNTAKLTSDNAPGDEASDSVTCLKPDVTFTKKADNATVSAGDAIGFTITAKNTGDGKAKNVTLSDTLPAGPTWTISPANPDCSITSGVLSCDFGDLAKGDSAEVHVTATTSETECGTYDNTAKLTIANAPEKTASDSVTCDKPGLAFDKAAVKVTVNAGEDMSFDLTTSNAGPGIARSVTLSDTLPGTVTWQISAQPLSNPCSITAGVLNCAFGDLAAGDSVKITITAKTSFQECAVYENTATADAINAPAKSDTDTITCQKPSLTITKKADAATVNAGEAIGFTVKVVNNGDGTAKNVKVSDPLPAGPTWTISPANADCSITSGTLNCSFGDLAKNDSAEVHITADTSYAECSKYDNTAKLTSDNAPDDEASDSVTCRSSDVTFTKKADNATVSAGEPIGFTITVKNNGTGTAKNATVSDTLPAGPAWTISPANADCSITTGVLNCSFGDLAQNDTASVHITADTSYAECSKYDNTAKLTLDNAPGDEASDTVTCLKPDVAITKKADNATVNAGEPIGFTMLAKNNGDGTAKGVTLSDTLPAGPTWTISPAQGDCSITAGVLSCSFGNLGAGDSADVHITADTSYAECSKYDNTAKLTAENQPEREASDSVTCLKPDVTFTKKADAATVDAGDAIGFTMTAKNTGDGKAKNVTLTDTLPAGPTWTIDPANPDCSITSGVLSCDFGDLAKGDSAEVHVTATTSETECGTYDNTAKLTIANAPEKTASDSVTCNKPTLDFTKAALKVTVDAGDDMSFDLTTSNAGPGTAKGVTLSDTLPAGVTWLITGQPSGDPCSITAGVLSCSFGDLKAGESVKVTITAKTSFEQCTKYENSATADAINAPSKTDSDTITCQTPKVTQTKTAKDGTINAGEDAQFTITTSNSSDAGTGTAKGVVVKDDLPASAGADWSIVSPATGCAITGAKGAQKLLCDPVDLAPGASFAVTVKTATGYGDDDDRCGVYTNTATFVPAEAIAQPNDAPVDPYPNGGNAGSGTSNEATITCEKPNLTFVKKADQSTVDAGDKIGFTMTVSNSADEGTGTAKDVKLDDLLPGGVTWSIDPANADCQIAADQQQPSRQRLTCDFGSLASDDSASVHVSATTSFQQCSVYENGADITASNHPTVASNDTVACRPPATVRIVKQVQGQENSTVKFDFTSDLTPNAGDQSTSFSLSQADGAKEFTVRPGKSYTITEADATLTKDAPYVSSECVIQPRDEAVRRSAARELPARSAATGELAPGDVVTCTFTNKILTPKIAIEKTGPATAVAGELITYNLKVTNTGETQFNDGASGENGAVVVTDPLCQAPPKLVAKDGDKGDASTLSPGEFWTYQCQVATKVGDTLVDNTANVTGKDTAGKTATASSNAKTTLSQPGGGVSPVTPSGVTGRAKLTGTVGCAANKWAKATVGGSNIKSVTYYVNGRKVLTLTKPNVGGNYQLRYRVKTLKYGAYKVRAKVQFTSNASPRTKTLSLQFSRCKPRIIKPKFTG